jgi:hypothetical protein
MRTRIILAVLMGALLSTVAVGAFAAKQNKAAKNENRALFAAMNGKKEVNAETGRKNAGDPDGRGSFTAIVDGDQLCYGITVKNLDAPVAAHIHRGQPDEAGPVVVALTAPTTGDPGASSACITVDPTVSRAILKNPGRYYVNVHTGPFPGGAVRNQLHRRGN